MLKISMLKKGTEWSDKWFLEHQKKAEAQVMQGIDNRQKREIELLEKMCKDDRDHKLRLVQILGQ